MKTPNNGKPIEMTETMEERVTPTADPSSVSPFTLFFIFFRLGAVGFGGPAMIAYIRDLCVKKKRWLTPESFQQGIPLCQTIPGATAVQVAGYVGLRVCGPLGAAAAFTGFMLPAALIMTVLSVLYKAGQEMDPVLAVFRGLQVIVIAIIANGALNIGRGSIQDWRDGLLAACAAVALGYHTNPILVILVSALVGIGLYHGAAMPMRGAGGAKSAGSTHVLTFVAALVVCVVLGLVVLYFKDRSLFDLSTLMMKIDLFAFGGGYASVPLMLHEVVEVRGWLNGKAFIDGIALGQVTPGPIVITATFVGYHMAGLLGAAVGSVSVFLPSFLILLVAVPYFDRLNKVPAFRRAMRGVLASFVGLLASVAVQFAITTDWTVPSALIAAAAFAAFRLKVDILWVVLAGAVVSVFVL